MARDNRDIQRRFLRDRPDGPALGRGVGQLDQQLKTVGLGKGLKRPGVQRFTELTRPGVCRHICRVAQLQMDATIMDGSLRVAALDGRRERPPVRSCRLTGLARPFLVSRSEQFRGMLRAQPG